MFWLLLAVFTVFVFIIYFKNKNNEEFWKHIMAIPGPKVYPIIGTHTKMYTLEELFVHDRDLFKRYFPILKIIIFNVPTVIIMHPDDMELVLSNSKHIDKGPIYNLLRDWLGFGILTNKGKNWHKRRKMLAPAFSFKMLQSFVEIFNKETANLVDTFRKECHKSYISVVEPIHNFTLNSIAETSLGIELSSDPLCSEYKKAVDDYLQNFMNRVIRPWLHIPFLYNLSSSGRKTKKIVQILHNFSNNVIRSRNKTNEENDKFGTSERENLALLDLMLKYKNQGEDIDDLGIVEELDNFIFGGYDTTAGSLAHTLMLISNEQEIQKEIYQEITAVVENRNNPSHAELGELKYMERCIKESLRLYPIGPVISRIAGEDIKTKTGYTIPKGCAIFLPFYDMHRNPEIWENPEKFDPDRFLPENVTERHPYAFLPFSGGSRNCLGQKYAILQLKAVLCGILKNFKLEPVTRPSDMIYRADIVLRNTNEIKVKFVLRN